MKAGMPSFLKEPPGGMIKIISQKTHRWIGLDEGKFGLLNEVPAFSDLPKTFLSPHLPKSHKVENGKGKYVLRIGGLFVHFFSSGALFAMQQANQYKSLQ